MLDASKKVNIEQNCIGIGFDDQPDGYVEEQQWSLWDLRQL